jgi:hypothetical protein
MSGCGIQWERSPFRRHGRWNESHFSRRAIEAPSGYGRAHRRSCRVSGSAKIAQSDRPRKFDEKLLFDRAHVDTDESISQPHQSEHDGHVKEATPAPKATTGRACPSDSSTTRRRNAFCCQVPRLRSLSAQICSEIKGRIDRPLAPYAPTVRHYWNAPSDVPRVSVHP